MKFILTLCLCIGGHLLFAQSGHIAVEVIGEAGGFTAQVSQGSVAYTIGEPVVEYAETSNGSASQGFQQVFEGLLLNKVSAVESTFEVYPNPFLDEVNVRGAEFQSLQVFDLQGRLLHQQSSLPAVKTIDMSALPAGTYLFRFSHPSTKQSQTLRLIKQ